MRYIILEKFRSGSITDIPDIRSMNEADQPGGKRFEAGEPWRW